MGKVVFTSPIRVRQFMSRIRLLVLLHHMPTVT